MNELIRDLARRAGFKRINTERYAAISEKELNAFVKLVVEECANIATPIKQTEILEKFGLHND
jgi:hypothetical protein